jgi:hypothetical protein
VGANEDERRRDVWLREDLAVHSHPTLQHRRHTHTHTHTHTHMLETARTGGPLNPYAAGKAIGARNRFPAWGHSVQNRLLHATDA